MCVNKTVTDPEFCIQNNIIERKTKAKYLDHIISEDMSDDADVFRQVKCLYCLLWRNWRQRLFYIPSSSSSDTVQGSVILPHYRTLEVRPGRIS